MPSLEGQRPPSARCRAVAEKARARREHAGEERGAHTKRADETVGDLEERHFEQRLAGEREAQLHTRGA